MSTATITATIDSKTYNIAKSIIWEYYVTENTAEDVRGWYCTADSLEDAVAQIELRHEGILA